MNKITTLVLALCLALVSATSYAQTKKAAAPAKKNGMAKFADKKKFKDAHVEPVLIDVPRGGKLIDIDGVDGAKYKAFEVAPADANEKTTTIFMIHEWWGLNNHIMKEAISLSNEMNVRVVALDLYGGMKSATTQEQASELMKNADEALATATITAAFKKYDKAEKTATIGWCFGGGWSLQAAMIGGKKTKACVMYYGMPEEDVTKLRDNLKCDVLFIFAEKDHWINKEVVSKFEDNMKVANKLIQVVPFPADHAFANPSNPQFDKESTYGAHKVTMEFLKKRLEN